MSRTEIKNKDVFHTKPTGLQIGGSVNANGPVPTSDKVYYTIHGKHDDLDVNNYPICDEDSKKDYAKRVVRSDEVIKYYIRVSKSGQPFNPIGIDQGKSHAKKHNDLGDLYPYLEVNKKVFRNYVDFLRTKNTLYLEHVARAILNKG